MALTDKSKAFARAKLQGKNNKEAAMDAGYSASSASSKGSQLNKDPEVLAYIEKLTKVKAETGVDPTETLRDSPNSDIKTAASRSDPLAFLLSIMDDSAEDTDTRVNAAKAALPYCHGKIGEVGKKESRQQEAGRIAGGQAKSKFQTMAPPKQLLN